MKNNFGQIKMQFPLNHSESQKLPFYILNIGAMENQHPCYRNEGLADYQFLFCTAGKGHLVMEGKEYTITPGTGMYFRPHVAHEYYAEKEPWTTHWIMFNGLAVDFIPSIHQMGDSLFFYVHSMDKLTSLHNKIYSAAELNGLLNINEASVLLYQFLLEMNSCIGTTPKNKQDLMTKRFIQVVHYIESNYNQDITLTELSEIAGITPQHFCRLFKNYYHMRPMEYLIHYRIKHAKHLLTSQKELTLKEIAAQIGFHDLSYFCAVFKKSEGMTPLEFKKMH